jgi:hypothetical protein
MLQRALAFTLCLLPASVAFAQTKTPVEGVWRVAEGLITGANAASISNPQPGLYIFTRGYYSVAIVDNLRPAVAPAKDPPRLTDAEKIARYEEWLPFHANSGAYEIRSFRNLRGSQGIRVIREAACAGRSWGGRPARRRVEVDVSC